MWKELFSPSVIFTEVNSLIRTLPVNVDLCLAIQTYFGQENPKFHAENSSTSISEAQRVQNLEEKFAEVLQEVNLTNIWVGGRVVTMRK